MPRTVSVCPALSCSFARDVAPLFILRLQHAAREVAQLLGLPQHVGGTFFELPSATSENAIAARF